MMRAILVACLLCLSVAAFAGQPDAYSAGVAAHHPNTLLGIVAASSAPTAPMHAGITGCPTPARNVLMAFLPTTDTNVPALQRLLGRLKPWENAAASCPGRPLVKFPKGQLVALSNKDVAEYVKQYSELLQATKQADVYINRNYGVSLEKIDHWQKLDESMPNWRILWPLVAKAMPFPKSCNSPAAINVAMFVLGPMTHYQLVDSDLIPAPQSFDGGHNVCTYAISTTGETVPLVTITMQPDSFGHLVGNAQVSMTSSVPYSLANSWETKAANQSGDK